MAAMSYAEKARLSNYEIENGLLVVKNAWLLWRNFAGDPNKNYGHRGFTLLLDETIAGQLIDLEWNVKKREPKNEGDEPYYITEVSVNPDCLYPPVFILYTEFNGKKSAREMTPDEIWKIDEKIRIQRADVVVSRARQGGRYLQELRITERSQKSYFGDEYAAYEVQRPVEAEE